ncbi:MAG: hypothetical protein U0350_20480 [Caldilineaceae bacterium]
MAAYDWTVLKRQWERAELSTEQMVGQLLQWGEQTHQQNVAHERQLAALERQLAALTARVAALESQRLSK